MAVLISAANGNLTDILTVWDSVEVGTGAIQTTVSTKTSKTSTTYSYSTQFTMTNLDVIDGVMLFLKRNGVTGTVKISLSADGGVTATRELTVNASDLPSQYAWVFFKFGSTLVADGGSDYSIGVAVGTGGDSGVTIGGSSSTNYGRYERLTSLATAAAGDVMYIVGEHTGAGATTTRTITMDSVATTDYGTGTDGAVDNGIEIGDAGILTYGTAAATNYYLKLSGSLNVWGNGILNIGTTGTPIPRGSTAVLEFDPVADGGMGLIINDGGVCNLQGLSRTSGKDIYYCKLNTDEAVDQTTLGVDTDTGWLDNDEIAVFSTTRTGSQTEAGTLNGAAGASSLTVDGFAGAGGGLANAHSGTSPTQAEVILLSRNVEIRSATSTLMAYVFCSNVGTLDADWVRFRYLGENATNKRGIEIPTGAFSGSFSVRYCALRDFEDGSLYTVHTSGAGTVEFSNNVSFNVNSVGTARTLVITGTSNVPVLNANILHGVAVNSVGCIQLQDNGLTFTNNVICLQGGNSSSLAVSFEESSGVGGTHSGNTIHSCPGFGLVLNATGGFFTMASFTAWRNGFSGVAVNAGIEQTELSDFVVFGNTLNNIDSNTTVGPKGHLILKNPIVNGDASFSTADGLDMGALTITILILGGSFGATTAHTTRDVGASGAMRLNLFNTVLASTEVAANSSLGTLGYIRSHKNDASASFKAWYRYGAIVNETAIRNTASGYSWKLTPNNASNKLVFPGPTPYDTYKVALANGVAVAITAYVYKDSSYAGNAPRLVVVGGIVAGVGSVGSDLIDSLTVAHSNWEQLSVAVTPSEDGVVEFYIDCDGTAGNVYVDDLAVA